jgi:predicted TIM-barrel fold metal-dependent hydrolase
VIIDIHGHLTSPALLATLPMPPSLGDVDGMIEQKASAGITTTIVGSPVGASTMVRQAGPDQFDQPLKELEAFHDWVAETVRAHPAALKAYVYANPYGGDRMLELTARRLAQEEFVGLIVNTSVRGRYLDQPEADGFFALAAEHRAPVLLHPPAEPVGAGGLGDLGLVEHIARPCDVTLGVAAVLFAGWLEKYPDLQLIVSNAGGALALLREKLDLAGRRSGRGANVGTLALRRLHVDTASPSQLALAGALETFGADRMLFGTDSPPLTGPLPAAVDLVSRLPVSSPDRERVLRTNAQRLFALAPVGSRR